MKAGLLAALAACLMLAGCMTDEDETAPATVQEGVTITWPQNGDTLHIIGEWVNSAITSDTIIFMHFTANVPGGLLRVIQHTDRNMGVWGTPLGWQYMQEGQDSTMLIAGGRWAAHGDTNRWVFPFHAYLEVEAGNGSVWNSSTIELYAELVDPAR